MKNEAIYAGQLIFFKYTCVGYLMNINFIFTETNLSPKKVFLDKMGEAI